MGRCVLVLGAPRSGTSCVSGVLHHLGVNMGMGHLGKGNAWNQRGYYEDLRWQKLNKQITGERYGHEQPKAISKKQSESYKALAELCDTNYLWGIKDPRLCFTAQFIWPWLADARIVSVERPAEAAAVSLMRHSQGNYKGRYAMNGKEARALIDLWNEARENRLRQFWGPVLRVQYQELVDRPDEGVDALARFAFHGIRGPSPDRQAAVKFIEPGLMHHA